MALSGGSQQIVTPAGGTPAAVSSIPGLGGVLGAAASLSGVLGTTGLSAIPGQTARFGSAPLPESMLVVGSSKVGLTVTAGRTGAVTLFASLHDLAPDGTDTLPARLVSPISLTGQPGQQHSVTVQLPWIVQRIPAGHRLVVEVSTTDFAYALPVRADSYRIALAGPTLSGELADHQPGAQRRRHRLAAAGDCWWCWPAPGSAGGGCGPGARCRRIRSWPTVPVRGQRPAEGLLRRLPGGGRGQLPGGTRPGARPARAERSRQDHHAAGADGADPAHRRHGAGVRRAGGARRAGAGPVGRLRRGAGIPAAPDRRGEPAAVLGRVRPAGRGGRPRRPCWRSPAWDRRWSAR